MVLFAITQVEEKFICLICQNVFDAQCDQISFCSQHNSTPVRSQKETKLFATIFMSNQDFSLQKFYCTKMTSICCLTLIRNWQSKFYSTQHEQLINTEKTCKTFVCIRYLLPTSIYKIIAYEFSCNGMGFSLNLNSLPNLYLN